MKPSDVKVVLSKLIQKGEPILIVGSPGVGKTDLVTAIANDLQYKLIIAHPVVDSPIDYKGLPFKTSDNKAEFLPYGNLNLLIEATEPTIFFLDDLGQATDSVQAAVMQLLLSRSINGKKISDSVRFVAATNQKSDKAAVSAILEPVKSRFITIIKVDVDTNDWLNWASENNMPMELIAFVNMSPDYLLSFQATAEIKNSPCPRTIANMGRLHNIGFDAHVLPEIFSGAVGEKMAFDYINFLDVLRDAPMFDDIINNPTTCKIPEPSNVSMRSIVCATLVGKANSKNFANIIIYASRMNAEYAQSVITGIVKQHEYLKDTSEYINWNIKNQNRLK